MSSGLFASCAQPETRPLRGEWLLCWRGQRVVAVVLLNDLLGLTGFEVVAPGVAEMDAAYSAFVAFGRGSGRRAALNFGDVFSHALAKARGLSLLYKRDDFAQTDVVGAHIAAPA